MKIICLSLMGINLTNRTHVPCFCLNNSVSVEDLSADSCPEGLFRKHRAQKKETTC